MRLNFFKATCGRVILLGFTILVIGCAGKGEEQVLITVSPESTVVTLGDTEKFESSLTDVTWSVDGILGGNEGTVGKIDSSGLYTAPADPFKAPEKVSIKATDPSGTAVAVPATAFLTTFNANTRLTTHYDPGTAKANPCIVEKKNICSAGQRGIGVYKDTEKKVNVYAVWMDNSSGRYQVWFTKNIDGSGNFCKPVRIAGSDAADQFSPSIAVNSSGDVYVAWEDDRDGDEDIYVARYDGTDCSFDGTEYRWSTSPFSSPPVKVNRFRDPGPSTIFKDSSPAIAVDSDEIIYVVWEDRFDSPEDYPDIYFARILEQGQTVSTNTFIANNGRRPALSIDSSGVAYVVWEDLTGFPDPDEPTNIKMRKIVGDTAGVEVELPALSGSHARFPSVAVDPSCNTLNQSCKVYIVWQRAEISEPKFESEIIDSYDFYLSTVETADGTTWQVNTPVSITDNPGAGLIGGPAYPSIAADNTGIYIAWDDQRNGTRVFPVKDIYFAKSTDGINFTTNRIVNDDTGTDTWHERPSIAVLDSKAYIIWTDYRNTFLDPTGRINDVFFARE